MLETKEFFDLIWNKEEDKIKELINEDNSYLQYKDGYEREPLYHFANCSLEGLVKFAIEKGADINHADKWGETAIHQAANYSAYDMIEYMIDKGADINIKSSYSSSVLSLLLDDYRRDQGDVVPEKLLKKVIDNTKNIDGGDLNKLILTNKFHLYKYAIETKNISKDAIILSLSSLLTHSKDDIDPFDKFKYLIENNHLDINDKNGNYSVLQTVAMYTSITKFFDYLFDKGVDIKSDQNENVLLIMAAKNDLKGFKYFQDKGANIHFVTKTYENGGNSVIADSHRYTGYNYKEDKVPDCFKYLVDQGVDLTVKNQWGKGLLLILDDRKRKKSVKYIYTKVIDQFMNKVNDTNREKIFKELFEIQQYAPAKKEKEYIVKTLVKFPEFADQFLSQLSSSKVKLRELAVNILISLNKKEYVLTLKERSEVETNKTILKSLNQYLGKKKDIIEENKKVLRDPKKFKKYTPDWFEVVAENDQDPVRVSWLKLNDLEKLSWEDGKQVDDDLAKYFLKNISKPLSAFDKKDYKDMIKLVDLLNKESLENFFNSLYSMPPKLKTDDKWIFNIYYLLAEIDSEYLKKIDQYIDTFIYRSRGAFAGNIVEQMIYMDSVAGIKKVDWYSRKIKHKGVKNSANYAISSKARALGLTSDQLRDTLISDFGLNDDREVVVDYGTRSFTLKLMPDYTFQIKDDKGKIFKNLPKPGKNDDLKKGEAAKKFLKDMKKEIKDIIKIQKERLEYLFTVNKLQTFPYWSSVFVKNPVLNIFASNLFWGVYNKEGKLETVFRYNEDKTFTNLDDDEIVLKESDNIGLVHPIDLTDEQIKKAEEIIEDFEIIQPLKQIGREVFNFEGKKDIKEVVDFDGFKFYPKSMNYKLLKDGWEKGYVVDNGFFEDYNRKVPELNITATLDFSGADIYMEYDMDQPATWGKLRFKKSYKIVEVSKLDKRVYSEIYRSLYLLSKTKI